MTDRNTEWPEPRPMSEAPRDGTIVLAWWPETLPFSEETHGWVTTWWGRSHTGMEGGWECPLEWECPESKLGPTHWLPHPKKPGETQ